MAQAFRTQDELSWMQTRNIEYANYATTFSMNGKRVFRSIKKPKDLYTLPSEDRQIVKKKNTAVFDLERAEKAYNQSNNKPKWHKTS